MKSKIVIAAVIVLLVSAWLGLRYLGQETSSSVVAKPATETDGSTPFEVTHTRAEPTTESVVVAPVAPQTDYQIPDASFNDPVSSEQGVGLIEVEQKEETIAALLFEHRYEEADVLYEEFKVLYPEHAMTHRYHALKQRVMDNAAKSQ